MIITNIIVALLIFQKSSGKVEEQKTTESVTNEDVRITTIVDLDSSASGMAQSFEKNISEIEDDFKKCINSKNKKKNKIDMALNFLVCESYNVILQSFTFHSLII